MFLSKMIYDPTQVRSNLMGRTVGLVFHTPKFWDCKKYNFYTSQFDTHRDGLSDETKEERYQSKKAHENCRRKHMSYKGYMYWIGPKRRYQFNYMGDINPHNSNHPWFYVQKHGMYVRWFDNGPQNPKSRMAGDNDERWAEVMKVHQQQFSDAMARSRAAMEQYAAKRDAGWTP